MDWIVERIQEGDYGCEERAPDEPLRVLVTLRCGEKTKQLLFPDDELYRAGVDVGSLWPEGWPLK